MSARSRPPQRPGAERRRGRSGARPPEPAGAEARRGRPAARPPAEGPPATGSEPRRPLWLELALLLGAFAAGTLVAEALGAANLGTALAIGQIAFALALVWVLVHRPH
jgi:hypothetical protein